MKKIVMGIGLGICLMGLISCKQENKAEVEDSSSSVVQLKVVASNAKKTEQSKASDESSTTKKAESTTSSATSSTSTKETTTSTSEAAATLWNASKASQLQSFMSSWGTTMKQSYSQYQPGNSVDFYGLQLPDGVLGSTKTQPIAVSNQIVSAEWSNTGQSASAYSIVAVYSDAATASYMGKHVYFFGFTNNQPVALVSMQNQGMPDGALHFAPTENHDLTVGFQSIANS